MDEIIDLNERRNNIKNLNSSKEKKEPLAAYFKNLSDCLNDHPASPLPYFPRRFVTVEPEPGKRQVLEVGNANVVTLVNESTVAFAVMDFIHNGDLRGSRVWSAWVEKTAKDFVRFWLSITSPIEMPKPWAWLSDPEPAFCRLPWDCGETGPTPNWDEILGRTTNAKAFKAWIGSLFVRESDRQQYLWLTGAGRNSKGTVIKFLRSVLGPAFCSTSVPGRGREHFWTYELIGKRLVAFADTNDAGWPASGPFKSLSGDDPIRVEIKGGQAFTVDLECKFLFASQHKPTLSSETADTRRVILCEMGPISGSPDPRYAEKLYAEGGAFLTSCIETYRELCPDHAAIPTDDEGIRSHIEDVEMEFALLVQEHFEIGDGNDAGDVWVQPLELSEFMRGYVSGKHQQAKFREYLERRGFKKIRWSLDWSSDPNGTNRYVGLRWKHPNGWKRPGVF